MNINNCDEMISRLKKLLDISDSFFEELMKFDEEKNEFLKGLSLDEAMRILNNPLYLKYVRLILSLQYVEDPECREHRIVLQDNISDTEKNILKLQKN